MPSKKGTISNHALAGRKQTSEHIAKRMASSLKTKANWTEEQRNHAMKHLSAAHKNYVASEESKQKCSKAMKGKQNSLGIKRPLEFRKRLSEYWKDNPNHNFRIDGNGEERRGQRTKEMSRLEYRLWRTAIFERDNFICTICGKVGGALHADHIKPYSIFPELRFDVDNGRTLCVPCHKTTDTFAWKLAHEIKRNGGYIAYRQAWEEVSE